MKAGSLFATEGFDGRVGSSKNTTKLWEKAALKMAGRPARATACRVVARSGTEWY